MKQMKHISRGGALRLSESSLKTGEVLEVFIDITNTVYRAEPIHLHSYLALNTKASMAVQKS